MNTSPRLSGDLELEGPYVGNYSEKQRISPDWGWKVVENLNDLSLQDLKILLISKVQRLYLKLGSWGKLEKALGGTPSKTSLKKWSKNQTISSNPRILMDYIEKMAKLQIELSDNNILHECLIKVSDKSIGEKDRGDLGDKDMGERQHGEI